MSMKTAIGCFILLTTLYHGSADVNHLAGGNSSPGFKHTSGTDVPVINDLNSRSFDQHIWNIRDSIPGEPDVDYPIYSVPPISSFSCKDRHYGYYADVEARCQVFRVCTNTDLTGKGFAFLCPNGTLFNQNFFVCDWYKNVDCSASESFFSRNEVFGSTMSENDMMSVVQVMVDYTRQPQFNNQKVNNNGGIPIKSSGILKQFGNNQGSINQNNGLAPPGSVGSNNVNRQQQGSGISNQGQANVNSHISQRGSEVLSQPIFPSGNNIHPSSTQNQGTTGSPIPISNLGSNIFNQNVNFNTNGHKKTADNNGNNYQPPQVFVSSLGEISTNPDLKYNPFTTALISTKTFDTLSSNVNPVSASANAGQKFLSHGQFNQINDKTQFKSTQLTNGYHSFNAGKFPQNTGLNNRVTLQQEINHLSVGQSNIQQSTQQSSIQSQQATTRGNKDSSNFGATNSGNVGSSDQSGQTLTAVYTGSGDLLSQTINQYGKHAQSSSLQTGQTGRDPNLSALVNSLGETILTPVFTGEGNLLGQTISQRGKPIKPENDIKTHQGTSTTVARFGVSTPQPLLRSSYYNAQTRVTNAPIATSHSAGSHVQENRSNVVLPGEGNLLSQTIGQRGFGNIVYSGEGNLLSQTIGQRGSGSTSTNQGGQKHTPVSNEQKSSFLSQKTNQGSAIDYSTRSHESSNKATGNSVNIHATPSVPSGQQNVLSQSFGQRTGQRVTDQSIQQSLPNVSTANQKNSVTQTAYNNRISFGQKLSTKPAATSSTAAPYSPSIPPFRSTTSIHTPTSSNQQNQQHYKSQSYTQPNKFQSSFTSNQFQVPAKEYLPNTDNTRTARTNELSLGNHGASALKLISSQNVGGSQQDSRQKYTYPVDQTNSKLLENANDLPYLGVDADTTKQNLTNRDVTHLNKYLDRQQVEPTKNDTTEQTVITDERNVNYQLSSISFGDIVDLNRILQEGGKSDDTTSDEINVSAEESNKTEKFSLALDSFSDSPIVVAPANNALFDDEKASNDIQDSEALARFEESANLLFKGLQLSLYEERELASSEIKNELNDDIFRGQDVFEEKIRNPKDVHGSGGGLKPSNSIKLIFERAKNRSNDFRVKLKSKKEEENKAKRTFVLPQKSAEEKLVTILKPLLRNITTTPNKYLENNTKIGGFINNDLKFSIGEPRQRHSLAPRILFKNVKTIEDIERIATGIDTPDSEDDELTSETKLSNRIAFPDSIILPAIYDSDKLTTNKDDPKMKFSSIYPSIELGSNGTDWSYYTKTMLFPQKNQPKRVTDHETAASNRQSYTSKYSSSQHYSHQQASSSSTVYNQHNTYSQYHHQQPIHYATIDNRPNPSHSTFQSPPLQSHYPTAIQNNPQSHSSYHSAPNRYIPSVPSSIPSSLPTVVHPPTQYPSHPTNSFASNQSPKTAPNERVVVKIIPATGWYLNDPNERQSFLDAVSRGLLSDKGYVYVNDVQSSQRQSNLNLHKPESTGRFSQQPKSTGRILQQPVSIGRPQIDIDEEAYFHGSSSYESPLNSVGKLPGDSDSVSGFLDNSVSRSDSSISRSDGSVSRSDSSKSGSSVGYHYEHPRRSFNS